MNEYLIAMKRSIDGIRDEQSTPSLDMFTYCKHGLIKCTCGVCTNHKFSVAQKGGHVIGSSASHVAVVGLGFGR